MAAPAGSCFHCGEQLGRTQIFATINEERQPVCCEGCRCVAELIASSGLGDFYRYRDGVTVRPEATLSSPDAWDAYRNDAVARGFIRQTAGGYQATLAVEGLRCAACCWLIDRSLRQLPDVHEVSINAATARAHVEWSGDRTTLVAVLRTIAALGYRPHPLTPASIDLSAQNERRGALKRLAAAAFGMMQVMMFATSIYAAQIAGEVMDPGIVHFFHIVSLLVTTPLLVYVGAPIFLSAWTSIRHRSIGMDVPVSIALLLAYIASVWNTLHADGQAAVYFDSVTMFLFFLTLARFVQMTIRQRTAALSDALARQLPAYAHRSVDGEIEDVPLAELQRDDRLLVKAGEVIPADGILVDSDAHVDESMLTGESLPVAKRAGDQLAAGTLNIDGPLHMMVRTSGNATILSHIVALMQRGQALKPAMMRNADAAAAKFLRVVLGGAALTCIAWWVLDPTRAFTATVAVLVVACPCAFAIAAPSALAAATAHLAHLGVLVTHPDALEALARIDRIVFDKTGTLTRGDVRIERCTAVSNLSSARCLEIAAALELASEHPLSRAFRMVDRPYVATAIQVFAGRGVEGIVDSHRYRIGTPEFVAQLRGASTSATFAEAQTGTLVCLGDEHHELALILLCDTPRENAASAIAQLRRLGIESEILSGDGESPVVATAVYCGVAEFHARQSPEQKLAHVLSLQRADHHVAMVGDGVNDAPVLGAANVSIAMGRGAALAQASAGLVLIGEDLDALPKAIMIARRMGRIARQNLIWAALYNVGSLPLAALGLVPPWLAAVGMSVSSLAVMLNAMRLLPRHVPRQSTRSRAECLPVVTRTGELPRGAALS